MLFNVKYLATFFLIGLVLMGSKYDMTISDSLFGSMPNFSRFFEIYGELPVMLMGVISLAIFGTSRNTEKVLSKLLNALITILGWFLSSVAAFAVMSYLAKSGALGNSHGKVDTMGMLLAGLVGVIIYFIACRLSKKIKPEHIEYYRRVAVIGLILLVLSIVVVNLIKFAWGRPRYWSIIQGLSEFTPWYIINGPAKSNEFMSFISGHTANAFTLIFFSLLALTKSLQQKIYLLGIIWGISVGVSRIFIGQHFMTDIAFSGIFTLFFFELLQRLTKIDSLKPKSESYQ